MALEGSRIWITESAECAHSAKAPSYVSALRIVAFFAGFAIFGALGIATSLVCLIPALLFRTRQARRAGQYLIHQLFRFFLWYLDRCEVLLVDARELAGLRNATGSILVANHPSYLDAVIIAAKIPHVCCIMKSSLVGHPVLCGQSRLAGYVSNRAGSGLVRTCIRRVQEGSNLLIFPEGTRSENGLGPCKRGFALVARMTGRPVQTILVELLSPGFLGKGTPFFRVPELPVRYRLRLGEMFPTFAGDDPRLLGQSVEDYLRARVGAISVG